MRHGRVSRVRALLPVLLVAILAVPAWPARGDLPPTLLLGDSAFREEPWGYVRSDFKAPASPVPVLLMAEGYMGASSEGPPTHYLRMRDGILIAIHVFRQHSLLPPGYALAWASIRGTGCSGGTQDLFDRIHAYDGYEMVEWLAREPWSTGKIGLFGASYSGITALHIASTNPPHLVGVSANMVIDDLYRGIAYPGGVPNVAFPALWVAAYRPLADALGTRTGLEARDEICAQNVATRDPPYPTEHAIAGVVASGFTRSTDDPWWQVRSLITYASAIKVPTYISHAWQDEQTGPRGGVEIFDAIHPTPVLHKGRLVEPKKLVTTNGVHMTAASVAVSDGRRWADFWLKGIDNGVLDEPPVKLLFGTKRNGWSYSAMGVQHADAFPPSSAEWVRYYLRSGGELSTSPPGEEAPDAYVAGSPRAAWTFDNPQLGKEATMTEGPDVLTYLSPVATRLTTIAGPIAATLYARSTAPDTDFFVSVADVDTETGKTTYLARGMLRASHRALDVLGSDHNAKGEIIRPRHPHTNPTPILPTDVNRYEIEVFPLAHVVHPGHRIQVRVTTPPASDGLWGYSPARAPAVNEIFHDADRPSSILFPFIEWKGPLPREPACGEPDGYRCV